MKTYAETGLVKFEGNWSSIVNESLENNVPIASSEDIVSLRNKLPFEHDVWQYGGWTKEQPVYSPKNSGILVMNSMLLNPELAKQAVEANRNNNYLGLNHDKYELFLGIAEKEEKSKKEKRNVLILPSRDNFEISSKTNWQFAENLFGKENAERYFKKLSEKGINSIKFYTIDSDYVDNQSNPITTELWLRNLDYRSNLNGNYWDLGDDYDRAFGVRKVSGEATTQNNYNKQIGSYLKILHEVKEGNLPASKLEKVINGLEELRR